MARPATPPAAGTAFLGEELSAVGYRLAGIRTLSPGAEATPAAFRRLLMESELILVSVESARHLPAAELRAALQSLRPLVLVVPDVRGRAPMRDLGGRIRRELGVQG